MLKYVKWCKSLEDLASGKDLSVIFRTRRYSSKKLSRISHFLLVNGKQLSNTVFKVSPTRTIPHNYISFMEAQFLPATSSGVSLCKGL